MLLSIGFFVFDITVNTHEYDEESGEDFARKDVIGARKPYEHAGAGDETLRIRGNLFPDRLGGAGALEALKQVKATAVPQLVLRGDGKVLGWYLVTRISARNQHLGPDGAPGLIEMEVTCERCDQPSPASILSALLTLLG